MPIVRIITSTKTHAVSFANLCFTFLFPLYYYPNDEMSMPVINAATKIKQMTDTKILPIFFIVFLQKSIFLYYIILVIFPIFVNLTQVSVRLPASIIL